MAAEMMRSCVPLCTVGGCVVSSSGTHLLQLADVLLRIVDLLGDLGEPGSACGTRFGMRSGPCRFNMELLWREPAPCCHIAHASLLLSAEQLRAYQVKANQHDDMQAVACISSP